MAEPQCEPRATSASIASICSGYKSCPSFASMRPPPTSPVQKGVVMALLLMTGGLWLGWRTWWWEDSAAASPAQLPQVNLPQKLYLLHSLRQASMQHDQDQAAELSGDKQASNSSRLAALQVAQSLVTLKMQITHDLQHLVLMQRLRSQWQAPDSPEAKPAAARKTPRKPAHQPASQVCVVVRSHAAHGPSTDGQDPGSLRRLIESLLVTRGLSWQMLLVVSEAFPALQDMLEELSDHRITIAAKLVGYSEGELLDMSHAEVLNATNYAIQACSPHSRWVTITEGDNAYDPAFWLKVAQGPAYASVLAFDYYSQYTRQTAKQCVRFAAAAQPGVSPCNENLLRFGHTDLAAVVLDWHRWMDEGWQYTAESMLSAENKKYGFHDANIVQHVVQAGWEIHWVDPGTSCLLATGPCPHICAMQGGVWDDSTKESGSSGCLTEHEAAARAVARTSLVEMTAVQIAYDTSTFWQQGDKPTPLLWQRPRNSTSIKCLRELQEISIIERMKNAPRLFNQQCDLIDQGKAIMARTNNQLDLMLSPVAPIRHEAWKEETPGFIKSYEQLWALTVLGSGVVAVFGLISAYRSWALGTKIALRRNSGGGVVMPKSITVRRSVAQSSAQGGTPKIICSAGQLLEEEP